MLTKNALVYISNFPFSLKIHCTLWNHLLQYMEIKVCYWCRIPHVNTELSETSSIFMCPLKCFLCQHVGGKFVLIKTFSTSYGLTEKCIVPSEPYIIDWSSAGCQRAGWSTNLTSSYQQKKTLKCTGAHLSHPCYYLSLISEVVLVCVLEEKFPQCFRTRIQPHRGLCCMPTSCIQHQNGIKATCSPCSTGRQVQIHTQLLLETPHTLPSVFSSAFQINWVSQFNLVKQTVTDFLNAAN